MEAALLGWSKKGFAAAPTFKRVGEGGLIVYRCWGGSSEELGKSYYSLEKPKSVMDAELRFNIADYKNQIFYVSTFNVAKNTPYWEGKVFHNSADLFRAGTQIYIEPEYIKSVALIVSKQSLVRDAEVSTSAGRA